LVPSIKNAAVRPAAPSTTKNMHTMNEMSLTDLASTQGGGFWGDLFAAIGNALDSIIDAVEDICAAIKEAF
jgi:hypothetical protein